MCILKLTKNWNNGEKTHLKVELYGSDLKSILDQLIIQPEIPICSGIPINPITN